MCLPPFTVARMPRSLRALLLATLASAACGGTKGPAIHVAIAHAAAADHCVSGMSDDSLSSAGISQVRLSFRVHGSGDPQGSFLCDRLIDVGPEPPTLKLAVNGKASLDIFAEGFRMAPAGDPDTARAGSFRRVAMGSLTGIAVNAGTVPPLRLYPTQDFRCVDSTMSVGRAFHTATLLPNGTVLVVGGVVASPSDPTRDGIANEELFVTGSAELYDPSTGTFHPVMEPAPGARAFHQAALIGDQPPYQVLLVGGIAPTAGMGAQPQLGINTGLDGARLVPFSGPSALQAQAAGAEILSFDPTNNSATRVPVAGFLSAVFQAGAALKNGLAVAGGNAYSGMLNNTDLTAAKSLSVMIGAGTTHQGMLSTQRTGATMTALYDDTALVWGGARTPADPSGDLVSGLSGAAPSATMVTVASTPNTWFHTATLFASTASSASVLVTGGFEVQSGAQALDPPLDALRVVTVNAGAVSMTPVVLDNWAPADAACAADNRYRPAGWESAVSLGDQGPVLITGGTPRTIACNDCEQSPSNPLCSLHQASLFSAPATLSKLPALQIGRLGHTSTLLTDGTVLIIGGIREPLAGGGTRVVAEAEIYNSHTTVPPYDVAQPSLNDKDDPLFLELNSLKLQRAPGELARDPSTGGGQAKPCVDL